MHYAKRSVVLLIGLLVLAASQAHAAQFANPRDDLRQLADLVKARLALMPDVANWKAAHRVAVRDPAREEIVLEQVAKQADEFGLDPVPIRDFFRTQIDAACRVEADEIARLSGVPVGETMDLHRELRPRLDEISKQILVRLYLLAAETSALQDRAEVAQSFKSSGLNAAERHAIAQTLGRLRALHAPSMDAIRKARVLRIGSTGDYAPFSIAAGNELQGSDIEMAAQFADSLGLAPRFERTRWQSLADDVRAGRFDIAVGGISITPERRAIASFTEPYHHGGKTPIVRCGTQSSFDTLVEIDSPKVRVIVNPGGTNEHFVREHFTHAQVIVFPDNRAIFDEIVAGRADVMVTDDVEADLQARRNSQLCRATRQTFTQAAKAWMVMGDPQLLLLANAWLKSHSPTPDK